MAKRLGDYVENGSPDIASIHNWKDGINHCGVEHGTPYRDIRTWNVAGYDERALFLVGEALGLLF